MRPKWNIYYILYKITRALIVLFELIVMVVVMAIIALIWVLISGGG